jgi:hypothetical protein
MKMSEPNQTKPTPDDLLADFTDRVLDGKTSVPASPPNSELRGLEETVLRLKQTLSQEVPDLKKLRHMQANFRTRVRKADSPTIPAWQFLRPHRNLALAFTVALAILLIAFPFLLLKNGPVQGTAGFEPRVAILLAGVVCVIVLLIWARRK